MKAALVLLLTVAAWGQAPSILSIDGQSPPVYPSPNAIGTGEWASAYRKARGFVGQLTLEEKVNLTTGVVDLSNGCAGNIAGVPRLGFSGLCLHDAGNGVRATDLVNGYAGSVSTGASWNKRLAKERASFMMNEFRMKGIHVALGPAVGALGRVVTGGRNFDSFSVDPYLCGAIASETVRGGNDAGVLTSVKHFIANEQETDRSFVSSNIDDKTIHELYLWPFQDAIKAGTGSIMCGYNLVNNSYSCQNSKILNGLLKSELGFQGFVVSDWGAQHSGVATALAGMDMTMPDSSFWGGNLTQAVRNSSVPSVRINDMATRIIASWYYLGQDKAFPHPGIGMPADMLAPHRLVNAKDRMAKRTILAGAVEGHVLVKNVNNALPLQNPQILNVFGYDAKVPDMYAPDGTPIGWKIGGSSMNRTEVAQVFLSNYVSPGPSIASQGTLITGGGSGAITPGYISSPFDALNQRAYDDDSALFWNFESQDPPVPPQVDACLVFLNAVGSEAWDRPSINDEYSNTLVKNVAGKCSNTIVVIHNAGIRLVDEFVDHENVTAIVYAHLPGQDSGRALVSLLYGEENFSGKLPYTVARKESDYGDLLLPDKATPGALVVTQSNFSEGIYIDYHAFQAQKITPRYEFGFGLSYTTYHYTNLNVIKVSRSTLDSYPHGPIVPGGHADLWDVVAKVTLQVKNTGKVAGQEVVQLYLERMNGTRWLRGFDKIGLEPGESKKVTLELTRRDLSQWDVTAQQWKLTKGTSALYVGASSHDIRLSGSLTI